jgi:molybdate transport system regulatory protein
MGMSYRRAWILIDTMNRCFREPLVATAAGGPGGGGARVTERGRDVLARYRAMEAKAARALADDLDSFRTLLVEDDREPDDGAAG